MQADRLEQPRGRLALSGGPILLPDRILTGKVLLLEGNSILGIADEGDVGSDTAHVDVGGRYITPGLIDIHIHGALGHTFNDPSVEAFDTITRAAARNGVTSLMSSVATAPIDAMCRCLDFARNWMSVPHPGARLLGVHLEGPYISPAQKGALDPAYIRNPDDGSPAALLDYAGIVGMMTFAPELPGAAALAARLAALDIVPAAGHSMAKEQDVRRAMEGGLRHVTHLWSSMSSVVREGPWRMPGLLETALASDTLTGEIIADNKHLPQALMKLAYKCMGPDRLCAVSDASSGAGLPEGSHFVMGGMEYEVCDGVGMLFDRTAFAGSATLLNQMLPVLTRVAGIPLPEAVRMVTLTPARIAGHAATKGSLETGKDADVAVFEEDFTAWQVMIGGRWVSAA